MHALANRALATGIALALAGPAGAQVVVSQVYSGAGNTSSGYIADFIELHNNSNAAVDLGGWSVQYAEFGANWQRTPLSGSIPAGGFYLVRQRSGTGGRSLPSANATGSISMATSAGKVALVANNSPLNLACPTGLIDFVGYGSADCAEGAQPVAAVTGALQSQLRKHNGCTDSQSNAADFTVGTTTPRNASSTRYVCPPPPAKLSVEAISQPEGHLGTTPFVFELRLDRPAGPGGVDWSAFSNGGTATSGEDYQTINLNGRIEPGQISGAFTLPVRADGVAEADETVSIQVKALRGAVTANGDYLNTQATILDDDTGAPPPRMTVNRAEGAEGHRDYRALAFQLNLDRPAGPGGVKWRATTVSGGSATAVDDYQPVNASGTIPEGQAQARFDLLVRGDARHEPDETVKVQVDILSGAFADENGGTRLDTEALIVDDDPVLTAIHDIQGAGERSPMIGRVVHAEGIVTAVVSQGVFLQAPASETDADPQTSEGVFVKTRDGAQEILVGWRMRASGSVAELYGPGDHPQRGSMTAIDGATLESIAVPNGLPPVTDQPLLSGVTGYEALEGMRVKLGESLVVGPTGAFDYGASRPASDGRFYVVDGPVDTTPPVREMGSALPALQNGQPVGWLPRWDGNLEVLGVDSNDAHSQALDVSVGARVLGIVGPLDQRSGRYTVIQQNTATIHLLTPARQPAGVEAGDDAQAPIEIAHYDLGALYDVVSPPNSGQPHTDPYALYDRLLVIATGVVDSLRAPDIVAVSGFENLALLQQLAQMSNERAVADGLPDPLYRPVLIDAPDPLQTQIGFLVRGDQRQASSRVVVERTEQLARDDRYEFPWGESLRVFEQPPLAMDVSVHGDRGRFDARIVLVKLAPIAGSQADSRDGERLRLRRHAQAEYIAQWAQQHQQSENALPLLLLGDLQAHAFSDAFTDPYGTLLGQPSDPLWTLVPGDGVDRVEPNLIDVDTFSPVGERYSSIVEGTRQELQHALIDERMVAAVDSVQVQRARINSAFPLSWSFSGSPMRGSDTDPLHLRLVPRSHADLNLWTTAAQTAVAGQELEYQIGLQNRGPDIARNVGLGLAWSQVVGEVRVTAPAGWACERERVEAGRTSVACSLALLAPGYNGQQEVLRVFVPTLAEQAGTGLDLAVSATSQAAESQPGDNGAQATTLLTAPQP
ncbi:MULTISPECIES: lamin tail domain-containing protein [unclassified Lysobacter]|uniref:lamin tail domain-containing protein n=1 Tax=unclassified Lysobacter TaxID=2635362 RepID=UPI001BE72666|nr:MULTISPECIES: lamin tail domain-containing protein [unclassified Lysobacter]MBT2746470.1 lamin tail domain-containing protein [Lysobacter sp. ISL-42]MBT2753633.1 lamin tail domain-containing protein [Lysobacter sp. ISL-50]MBT2779928.1 lamin tail domain-containing protein [Lysobacter sp. ISL-54]MBT2784693.1 lamin tail domain-containing protein [Lysobacter sp. ISL-52]